MPRAMKLRQGRRRSGGNGCPDVADQRGRWRSDAESRAGGGNAAQAAADDEPGKGGAIRCRTAASCPAQELDTMGKAWGGDEAA